MSKIFSILKTQDILEHKKIFQFGAINKSENNQSDIQDSFHGIVCVQQGIILLQYLIIHQLQSQRQISLLEGFQLPPSLFSVDQRFTNFVTSNHIKLK